MAVVVQKRVAVDGGELAALSVGEGPSVIFLHGGPGDTHHYMRKMAAPLVSSFRCIFFDQRGTGGSDGFSRHPELFAPELLFADLAAIQDAFEAHDAALVGHSWGAMYALYASIHFPRRFRKAILLAMGPLDAAMSEASSAHLLSALDEGEVAQWQRLSAARKEAREGRDIARTQVIDREMMPLRVKSWVFNSELRQGFLNDYFENPPPDREVNQLIYSGMRHWFSWESIQALQTPLWLCSGANDSVPVAQAQRIVERAPQAALSIYEQCGHIPWLEHPERFYADLMDELRSGASAT